MLTAKLSHTELLALRDEGLKLAQRHAEEWSRGFPEPHNTREQDQLLSAMYIYGTCESQEGKFHPCKGLRDVGEEFVEVEFSDEAAGFMRELRDEYRHMLDDQRGSVELSESSVQNVFVVFVLDGIFGGDS